MSIAHVAFAGVLALLLVSVPAHAQTGLLQTLKERRSARAQAVHMPPGSERIADLAYGEDPAQRLDVYQPVRARAAPVVVMVHGGGWRRGDKRDARVVQNKIARWLPRGMILVSVNYRLLPTLDALQQADDVARAIAFVQTNASEWGGDPKRVVLMGHSAGAHLVALVNADPAHYARFGVRPVLGAVALDAGALDVVSRMQAHHPPLYDQAFGADPLRWRRASPTARVRGGAAPLLAVCSSSRKDDPCAEAMRYLRAAEAENAQAIVLPQPLSHRAVNAELGLPGPYTDSVERFLSGLDRELAARLGR